MLSNYFISKLHFRNRRKLWMVTSFWCSSCCMCIIYIMHCGLRYINIIMRPLGINLRIKRNFLYHKIYMFIICYLNCLWKCRNWWNMLLCSPNWYCHCRNLQIIIMYRCNIGYCNKCHNPHRMCRICCNNLLYNFRNWMHFIKQLRILCSFSWMCLGYRWNLLLGYHNNSRNSNNFR